MKGISDAQQAVWKRAFSAGVKMFTSAAPKDAQSKILKDGFDDCWNHPASTVSVFTTMVQKTMESNPDLIEPMSKGVVIGILIGTCLANMSDDEQSVQGLEDAISKTEAMYAMIQSGLTVELPNGERTNKEILMKQMKMRPRST